jgi:DNA helicase-2/ATP-dependent DNA helicase PcrA
VTPEIVLGPPGTGKTTSLLEMVDNEIADGTSPDRIGYVSFTKRAAKEAVERACEKFGLERSGLRYFRTLHSLCFQQLGLSSGDVFEGKKLTEFGNWLGVKFSEFGGYSDEGSTYGFQPGDRALFMENLARVRCVSLRGQYERDHDQLQWAFVERVARGLAQFKRDQHLVDYTDMLSVFAQSEVAPRLEVLFVDEAQDLSMLQWQVVEKLAQSCRRVVVAGDDDQAIYNWAGAAVTHFVGMTGQVEVLGRSFRCPVSVQELSQRVVKRIGQRRSKEWFPRAAAGLVERRMSVGEVDLWGEDVMVLVRNAYVAREFILPHLQSEGIIFEWQGHTSVRPTVLEGILVWEKLRRGEEAFPDEVRRVYDLMASGTGVRRGHKTLQGFDPDRPVTLVDLKNRGGLLRDDIWHDALDKIEAKERTYLLRALQQGEKLRAKPRVRVSTIHGAKGGEAEHVVLLTDMAPRTHREMLRLPDDEARVWYVAVTRAKEKLSLVAPRSGTRYDL